MSGRIKEVTIWETGKMDRCIPHVLKCEQVLTDVHSDHFNFFIHPHLSCEGWTVSEERSGSHIASDISRHKLLRHARARLIQYTAEQIEQSITKTIEARRKLQLKYPINK